VVDLGCSAMLGADHLAAPRLIVPLSCVPEVGYVRRQVVPERVATIPVDGVPVPLLTGPWQVAHVRTLVA
jgi:hypothetical protein